MIFSAPRARYCSFAMAFEVLSLKPPKTSKPSSESKEICPIFCATAHFAPALFAVASAELAEGSSLSNITAGRIIPPASAIASGEE